MKTQLGLLIIEDNLVVAKQLSEFFDGLSWAVDYADNGKQGIQLACSAHYDVVLLDLNLPDVDGTEVCKQIKASAETNLPILMLTARDAFEDKAEGFECGADDYVTKPFEFRELALRCQALARRSDLHRSKLINVGQLELDKSQRLAYREGQGLKLTKIGFDILVILAEAYPNAVTRSTLISGIWGEHEPESDVLRAHIYSLRTALDKPFKVTMLHTIINVGYKLKIDEQ